MHCLICQEPWEGDDITGYGPPQLNSPGQVAEIDRLPAALSRADVIRRFDGSRMEELEIYPRGGK